MSFALAALIVVAAGSVVLGLVAYHLLGRVHLLERAVQGGLEPPTRRLGREEFERRFAVASARSALARRFDTGLVVFIGSESVRDHELVSTLEHLARPDLVTIVSLHPEAVGKLGNVDVIAADDLGFETDLLGIATTPFAFVVDDGRVRDGRPLSGSGDLIALLHDHA